MNAHFQEIARKSENAICKPQIVRGQEDACMVSGWIIEIGLDKVNGMSVSPVMEGNFGKRISLSEWVWQNRKAVNDYVKAVLNA